MTECSNLLSAYDRIGRDGLVALIKQRIADGNPADNLYLLVDPSLAPLAGNLAGWPSAIAAAGMGRISHTGASGGTGQPLIRAMVERLPNGDRLLVGRDIGELDNFARQIKLAVCSRRRADIRPRGGRKHPGNPPHRGADRIDQRHQPGHHAQRSRQAHPAPRQPRRMGSRRRKSQSDAGSHRSADGRSQAGQRQRRARPAHAADADARTARKGLSRPAQSARTIRR